MTSTLNTFCSPTQLKSRLYRLLELSGVDTVQLDTVEFRWSGPEAGWLDLDILRNGELAIQTSISYYPKPFIKLVPWLYQIAHKSNPSSILDLDIERHNLQICCDYLGYKKIGHRHENIALFTLSLDWDDNSNPAFFVLPVYEFIRRMYYSLHDYFILHKAAFMQCWFDYEYEDDCLERIEAELTSKELEKRVARKGTAPIIPPRNYDIPQTEQEAFAKLDALISLNPDAIFLKKDLFRWICDNWVYGPKPETLTIKDKRAACFLMMSRGKYEYDDEWCFSYSEPVVYNFINRYYGYVYESNKIKDYERRLGIPRKTQS